jgi:hypothetical protein
MDAQESATENAAVRRKPTAQERHWTRLERLKRLDARHLRTKVLRALEDEWQRGISCDRILVRRSFARLETPLPEGTFSDRKLPPKDKRPPATRLIAPKGSALEMYLTALFVAQCTSATGRAPRNDRPVVYRSTDRSGLRPWSDLVAMPVERRAGAGRTYTSLEDNRVRQLGGTLKRLAADDVRLVDFPNAHAAKSKYEGFMLLDESGDLERASTVRYKVPRPGEPVMGLPKAFFLRGWHMVLSDSEMALLLALLAHVGMPAPWPPELQVQFDGETRIRFHGVSLDTYASTKYLAEYGILEVQPAPGRNADGTFEGHRSGARPIPHQLRILEEGFEKDAFAVVTATLKGMGARRPSL